jgi:gliding motility-associated-like protein
MGGELTWTCLGSGQFKFKMKFYRDCNGITPGSIVLTTTVPGVPTINLNPIQQNDISPNGLLANGVTSCPNCTDGSFSNPIPGLVEEYIYESAPVTLAGVPPATGWRFSWGECCRSSALTNIAGAGSVGFSNRAFMFPYNGQNTFPCYDSSPYFLEKPSTIICTGYPFKYNPNAVDPELDDMVYSWGDPLDENNNILPFNPGYSVNSQLPSTTQNAANVPASINPATGEISYTSFTGGYFATVVKVTAYKCNIKVAEIFREINVVLNNNCPPIQGGVQNLPPVVAPPFYNPATGLQTEYIDTVYAGDTVNFNLSALDFQSFINGTPETVTIEASGNEFGTGFSNPNAGCTIAPCATITPANPTVANPNLLTVGAFAAEVTFNWVTTCDHVTGLNLNCTSISNRYNFVIKASDNYCPANASNVGTISIVVLPPPKLTPPVLRCASVNTNGAVTLTWTKPCPRDSQNTFHSYEIYASLAAGGPYVLVDSVKTGFTANTYTHTLASLNALFATDAQQQSIYYYLRTKSGCSGDSISAPSDTLKTIKLNAVVNGANETVLTWNALRVPLLSSHASKYKIYKQFPIGTWSFLDSTALLTYTDTTTKFLCNDSVSYRVELPDSIGCISVSSLDGVKIVNPNPIANIIPANPAFCIGGNVVLSTIAGAVSYAWSTGQNTQSITVSTAGTYTVTVTQNGGCTSVGSTSVTVNPLPTPVITGVNTICANASTIFDAGPGYTSYLWSTTAVSQSINISTAGTYTVTVEDANGCKKSTTRTLTVNPVPVPAISGNTVFCQGLNSNLNAGAGYSAYQWSPGGAITQQLNVTTSGTYTVTVTANGCTGTTSTVVTVNPLPNPVITGTPSFCAGGSTILNAGAGFNSYLWSNGAATQTTTVNSGNTYTVTVTNAFGCSKSTSQLVTVNPLPTPVITGTNVICQGQNSIFDAGPGYSGYLWSNAAVTQTINVNTGGTYTVTVTDGNGCSKTTSRNLTVNPNPVPAITGITQICQGQTTTLNAGGGYTNYAWSNSQGTQTITVGTAGTYTATVTAANGCTASASATLTVNPLPSPVITGSTDFCQGLNTTLDAGPGYTNYLWSNGTTAQTITLNTATTVTVTVTNGNGCVNSTSVSTVVNPNPVPNITGTMTTCQGSTTVIDGGAGYSSYNWSTGATSQTINVGVAGPVTVTVTDGNGCIGTDNANITVFALPTAALSGIDTICAGQSTTISLSLAGPGPYTYTYFNGTANQGPFNTASANVNISVTPAASANYSMVSVSNANCAGTVSGTANISVTPLPTAQITGTTGICSGSSANLSVNFTGVAPYTYSYTAGSTVFGPFTTSNDPEIINVTPGSTTTYALTPTLTGAGCTGNTNAATAVITVNALPSATITGDNTICSGVSTDLLINFNGTGPFTYTYSNGSSTFGPFTTPNDPVLVPVTPGTSTSYTLIAINDANCPGSFSGAADITVNPLPTANTQGTINICDGNNTDISFVFNGTAPFTYSYTDGTGTFGPFVTNTNPVLLNVSPNATTTYGLTAVSDANCAGTVSGSAVITVIPLPTATLTGTTEICRGTSTNLNVAFTGVPPFEYKYTDGSVIYGPFIVNTFNTSINVSPLNTTNYSVTTVTGSGCGGSVSGIAAVTVNSIPDAALSLSGDNIICNGENSEFEISFNGIAPYTYSYSNGSATFGPFTTSNNPEVISVTPGTTTTYSLVTMADDKCTGNTSGTAMVTVNPLPVANVTGNPVICNGSSTSFNIGFTGSAPYTYTYSNGSGIFGPFTTSSNPEIVTVSPGVTTAYNVVTINDANCTGSTTGTANVTVNQIPSATVSGNATICYGDVTNLNFTFNGVAPFSYTYNNGTSNVGPLSSSTTTVSLPVSPSGTSLYTIVAVNDANCPGTFSGLANVVVNPLPTPVISGDFDICDGESSVLTTTIPYSAYTWSQGASTPSVISTSPAIYIVTVTDNNGCIGTSPAINFVVYQTPVISFTNDTSLTCEIPEINFTNNSSYPSNSSFTWEFGDGNTSSQVNPSHIFNTPGNYPITLTISTTDGCTATSTQGVDITFFPLPEAKFDATPAVTNVFDSRVLFTDQSQNAVSWYWDFFDGAKSIEQNPSHYFNDIGEYTVKLVVTNIAGCVDEYLQEIVVNPFYIPNAFTPNADGINDYFFDAGYVLDVKSYQMEIFNRWGQRVFVTGDYTKFWTGYDENGKAAPQGVYVYSIEVITRGGKKHQFNGTVTLLR